MIFAVIGVAAMLFQYNTCEGWSHNALVTSHLLQYFNTTPVKVEDIDERVRRAVYPISIQHLWRLKLYHCLGTAQQLLYFNTTPVKVEVKAIMRMLMFWINFNTTPVKVEEIKELLRKATIYDFNTTPVKVEGSREFIPLGGELYFNTTPVKVEVNKYTPNLSFI